MRRRPEHRRVYQNRAQRSMPKAETEVARVRDRIGGVNPSPFKGGTCLACRKWLWEEKVGDASLAGIGSRRAD